MKKKHQLRLAYWPLVSSGFPCLLVLLSQLKNQTEIRGISDDSLTIQFKTRSYGPAPVPGRSQTGEAVNGFCF